MKKLLLALFIILWLAIFATAEAQTASAKKEPKYDPAKYAISPPADTLVSIPESTMARYTELGKQIDNFKNSEWIQQQINWLTVVRSETLKVLLEAKGKEDFVITGYDEKTKSLIVKPTTTTPISITK